MWVRLPSAPLSQASFSPLIRYPVRPLFLPVESPVGSFGAMDQCKCDDDRALLQGPSSSKFRALDWLTSFFYSRLSANSGIDPPTAKPWLSTPSSGIVIQQLQFVAKAVFVHTSPLISLRVQGWPNSICQIPLSATAGNQLQSQVSKPQPVRSYYIDVDCAALGAIRLLPFHSHDDRHDCA